MNLSDLLAMVRSSLNLEAAADFIEEPPTAGTSWYFAHTDDVWETRTGRRINVGQMSDRHLTNSIRMLQRGDDGLEEIIGIAGSEHPAIGPLLKEAERRKGLRRLFKEVQDDRALDWKHVLRGVKSEDAALNILMLRQANIVLPHPDLEGPLTTGEEE